MVQDIGSATPAFFGFAGATLALILANIGAAYGTAKAGVGVSAMGQMNPDVRSPCRPRRACR
jgi:V-type H+-transporting ATPase proteolipid subunit